MSAALVISGHTRKRWLDRSTAPSLEPAVLWERGVEIPVREFDADEARYLPQAEVIVLRRGDVIATALEPDCHEPVARHAADQERGERP